MTELTSTALFCYLDLERRFPETIVLGSSRGDLLDRHTAHYPQGWFDQVEVLLGRLRYHLALRGFTIFPNGRLSVSPGSQAVYWAERDCGGYGFKIYSLDPEQETSVHLHKVHVETFLHLAGAPKVRLGNPHKDFRGQTIGEEFTVSADKYHQLAAGVTPALVMVKINGPDPLGRWDHHFFSR